MEYQYFLIETIRSLLDITAVACVIYFTLKLLVKSEKHTMVINAIFIILFLYAIASFLDLKALHSLVSNIYSWGLIIIVILFQQEIRGSLEKLGSLSTFMDDESEVQSFIDELLDAIYEMAAVKTGALITLERNSSLQQYTSRAVKVDAEFSKYLLMTIFHKDTPLHDGGVIINNGRIDYASTYYPISLDINVGKEVGTRHRAGLTLSKDTDALTIIVSEETGKVSVAYQNRLYNHLEREFLREMIVEKLEG